MGNAQPCCTAADVAKPPVEPQNLKMAAALGNIEEKEFASMSNAEFESYLKALDVSVGATVKLRRLHREQLAAAAPSAAEMGEDMGKLGLELAMLSVDELRKRACDSGINELVVNATEKAGKNALIALIVGQQGMAGAVQKAGGMPTAEGITSKITNALDADGDGQISIDEFIRGFGAHALSRMAEFNLQEFMRDCTLRTFVTGKLDIDGNVVPDPAYPRRKSLSEVINERCRGMYQTIRPMVPLRHGVSTDARPL